MTVGTLVLTLFLYIVVPKGFFPVQDTGVILGISDAPQSVSFPAMARQQQALARRDPAGPGRVQLVLFHWSRWHQSDPEQRAHSDQPEAARRPHRDRLRHYRRLQPKLAQVKDITLYMQPVQDLTVEDRVSRTQFQYTLEDPDATELNRLSSQLVDKLRTLPELRDVASDQQNGGQQTDVVIDRDTASRLGIPIATIDNTLEDAFAPAAGLDHLHAAEPIPRGARSGPAV